MVEPKAETESQCGADGSGDEVGRIKKAAVEPERQRTKVELEGRRSLTELEGQRCSRRSGVPRWRDGRQLTKVEPEGRKKIQNK